MKKRFSPKARSRGHSPKLVRLSTNIRGHYDRFLRLYKHPFGSKTSRYRGRAKAWLRSLRKGDEHYNCQRCWDISWPCDRDELRCKSCIDGHACCPRTAYFRKMLISEKLNITEEEFEELQAYVPKRRGRPFSRRLPPSSADESEECELEREEGLDQLEDGSLEPVVSSSRRVPATPSSLPSLPNSLPPRSNRRQNTTVQSMKSGTVSLTSSGPVQSSPRNAMPLVTSTKSSSEPERDGHVLKELTSIRSQLDRMDGRIKLKLTLLLGHATTRENKEKENLAPPVFGPPETRPGLSLSRNGVACHPQVDIHAYAFADHDNGVSPITLETKHESGVLGVLDSIRHPDRDPQDPGVEPDNIGRYSQTPSDDFPPIATINDSSGL